MKRRGDEVTVAAVRLGLLTQEQLERLRTIASDGARTVDEATLGSGLLTEADAARLRADALPAASGIPDLPPRYRFLGHLGAGGMGHVVRVLDQELGREVALKIILARVATRAVRDRFLLEAQTTAQLSHPNIVPIHDVGTLPGGDLYVTMKVVEGTTLRHLLGRHHARPSERSRDRIVRILIDVARALAFAHAPPRGVVHRDLKPENVMVGQFEETVVMDWGLAKILDGDEGRSTGGGSILRLRLESMERTIPGKVMGTVPYMAPEQVEGRLADIDARTDLWALGVMLYELLTGRTPFARSSALETATAILQERPTDPSLLDRTAPAELSAIALTCMAPFPCDRYRDGTALADDLRLFLEGRPVGVLAESRPRRLAKFVRRQPVLSGSIAAVFTILAVSVVVLSIAMAGMRAERRTRQAVDEAVKEVEEIDRWSSALGMADEDRVRARYLAVAASVPDRAFPWRALGAWYFEHRHAGTGAGDLSKSAILDRAAAAFDEALARDAEDYVALAYLFRIAHARRDFDEALALAGRLEALELDNEFGPIARAERLHLMADEETGQRRVELLGEALAAFEEALVASPESLWALGGQAVVHRQMGDLDASLAAFRRAVEIEPRDPILLQGYGVTLLALERGPEAVAAFERSLVLDPSEPQTHLGLANAFLMLDRLDECQAALERARQLDPELRNLDLTRAQLHLRRGEQTEAIALLERLLERRPEIRADLENSLGNAHRERAWVHLAAGRTEEAALDRRQALARFDAAIDGGSRITLWARAQLHYELGDGAAAIADFERYLAEVDDQDATVWQSIGSLKGALGDAPGAIAGLTRALELDPGHVKARHDRGGYRLEAGDREGAMADFSHVLEIDPGHAEARRYRALCALALGQERRQAGAADEAVALLRLSIDDHTLLIEATESAGWARANRGQALALLGRHEEALVDLRRAAAEIRPGPERTTIEQFITWCERELRRRGGD